MVTNLSIKRIADIGIALPLILLSMPLLLVIALVLWIDYRGNPFFVQWRTGLHGNKFRMIKFRTLSSPLNESEQPAFVSDEQQKVTRIGQWLRLTSLDELPQLFNVLKGDMSLVGPRPQPLNHLSYYGARLTGYERRHSIKPGLTGIVQVTPLRHAAHTLENMGERLHCDLYYIDHWSLRLDLKILCKTFLVVLCPPYLKQNFLLCPFLRPLKQEDA